MIRHVLHGCYACACVLLFKAPLRTPSQIDRRAVAGLVLPMSRRLCVNLHGHFFAVIESSSSFAEEMYRKTPLSVSWLHKTSNVCPLIGIRIEHDAAVCTSSERRR